MPFQILPNKYCLTSVTQQMLPNKSPTIVPRCSDAIEFSAYLSDSLCKSHATSVQSCLVTQVLPAYCIWHLWLIFFGSCSGHVLSLLCCCVVNTACSITTSIMT